MKRSSRAQNWTMKVAPVRSKELEMALIYKWHLKGSIEIHRCMAGQEMWWSMCRLWLGKSPCYWFPEAEEMISHYSPPAISCWSQRGSSFSDCSLFPWEAAEAICCPLSPTWLKREVSVGCTAVPKFSAFPNFGRWGFLLRITWTGVPTGRVQLGTTVKPKEGFFS